MRPLGARVPPVGFRPAMAVGVYRRWPNKAELVRAALDAHDRDFNDSVADTGSLHGDLAAVLAMLSTRTGDGAVEAESAGHGWPYHSNRTRHDRADPFNTSSAQCSTVKDVVKFSLVMV